jgi:hypothetical protein
MLPGQHYEQTLREMRRRRRHERLLLVALGLGCLALGFLVTWVIWRVQ